MKGEIDKDHFCGGNHFKDGWCLLGDCVHVDSCERCHCKWPTQEQFMAECGKEYPDDGAVYVGRSENDYYMEWIILSYKVAKMKPRYQYVVCACTPWGKPPDDWRPG